MLFVASKLLVPEKVNFGTLTDFFGNPEQLHERARRGKLGLPIKAKDILDEDQMMQSKSIYFFSIVSKKKHTWLTIALIKHALKKLGTLKERGKLKLIYASAATEEGERLLKRFKFKKIHDSIDRADNHPLYIKDIGAHNDLMEHLPTKWANGTLEIGRV